MTTPTPIETLSYAQPSARKMPLRWVRIAMFLWACCAMVYGTCGIAIAVLQGRQADVFELLGDGLVPLLGVTIAVALRRIDTAPRLKGGVGWLCAALLLAAFLGSMGRALTLWWLGLADVSVLVQWLYTLSDAMLTTSMPALLIMLARRGAMPSPRGAGRLLCQGVAILLMIVGVNALIVVMGYKHASLPAEWFADLTLVRCGVLVVLLVMTFTLWTSPRLAPKAAMWIAVACAALWMTCVLVGEWMTNRAATLDPRMWLMATHRPHILLMFVREFVTVFGLWQAAPMLLLGWIVYAARAGHYDERPHDGGDDEH